MITVTALRRATPVVAALILVACGDATGPSGFDPVSTNAAASGVLSTVEGNQAIQSLSVLSSAFTFDASGAPPAGFAITGEPAGLAAARQALLASVTPAFDARNAEVLLPDAAKGKTFVYNPNTAKYEAGSDPGAPADGVRFVLYAVDPALHHVVTPLNVVGYLDLRELSATSLGITAVIQSVTLLDYTASGSIANGTITFNAAGTIGSSTNQITFDLTQTFSQAQGLTFHYLIATADKQTTLDLTLTATASTANIDLTVKDATNEVRATANGTITPGSTDGPITGAITFNGTKVVDVGGTGLNPTFSPAKGVTLTQTQVEALKQVLNAADNVFSDFANLLKPAYFVLGLNILAGTA